LALELCVGQRFPLADDRRFMRMFACLFTEGPVQHWIADDSMVWFDLDVPF